MLGSALPGLQNQGLLSDRRAYSAFCISFHTSQDSWHSIQTRGVESLR